MNLFILSELQAGYTHVGWSVSHSLESTLASVLQPTFIFPKGNRFFRQLKAISDILGFEDTAVRTIERQSNRLLRSWYSLPASALPQTLSQSLSQRLPDLRDTQGQNAQTGPNVLLLIGLIPDFLHAAHTLGARFKQFDLRIAYFLDGFVPSWLDRKLLSQFDHLFVMSSELADSIRELGFEKTTFLPLGVNTAQFHPGSVTRWIDLLSYGRNNPQVHKCLQAHFNSTSNQLASSLGYQPAGSLEHSPCVPGFSQGFSQGFNQGFSQNSSRMYLHSTFSCREVDNQQEHETLMHKLLTQSKISLCFEASATRRFCGHSPLLYRWLEAWAAGCTVVGKRPFGKGVAELMDWPNSVIDLPTDPADWIPFFEVLLADEASLTQNAKRNRQQCLLRHDWCYRMQQLFDTVGLAPPPALTQAIQNLQAQAKPELPSLTVSS
jgi:hypothetical protein